MFSPPLEQKNPQEGSRGVGGVRRDPLKGMRDPLKGLGVAWLVELVQLVQELEFLLCPRGWTEMKCVFSSSPLGKERTPEDNWGGHSGMGCAELLEGFCLH